MPEKTPGPLRSAPSSPLRNLKGKVQTPPWGMARFSLWPAGGAVAQEKSPGHGTRDSGRGEKFSLGLF